MSDDTSYDQWTNLANSDTSYWSDATPVNDALAAYDYLAQANSSPLLADLIASGSITPGDVEAIQNSPGFDALTQEQLAQITSSSDLMKGIYTGEVTVSDISKAVSGGADALKGLSQKAIDYLTKPNNKGKSLIDSIVGGAAGIADKLLDPALAIAAYNRFKAPSQNPSQYIIDPVTGQVTTSSVTDATGTHTTLDPRVRALLDKYQTTNLGNLDALNTGLTPIQESQGKIAGQFGDLYTKAGGSEYNLDSAINDFKSGVAPIKTTQSGITNTFGDYAKKAGGTDFNLDAATGAFKGNVAPLQGQQADVYGKYGDLYSKAGANQGGYVQSVIDPTLAAGAKAIGGEIQSQGLRGIQGSSFGGQNLTNVVTDVGRQVTDAKSKALQESLGMQQGLAGSMGAETQAQIGTQKDIYGADQAALAARVAQLNQQSQMTGEQGKAARDELATLQTQFGVDQAGLTARQSQIGIQAGLTKDQGGAIKDQLSTMLAKFQAGDTTNANTLKLAGIITAQDIELMKQGGMNTAIGASNVGNQNAALARILSGIGGNLSASYGLGNNGSLGGSGSNNTITDWLASLGITGSESGNGNRNSLAPDNSVNPFMTARLKRGGISLPSAEEAAWNTEHGYMTEH